MFKNIRKIVEENTTSFLAKLSLRRKLKRDYSELYSPSLKLNFSDYRLVLKAHYTLRQLLVYYLNGKSNIINKLQEFIKKNRNYSDNILLKIPDSKVLNSNFKPLPLKTNEKIIFHFKRVDTIINHYLDKDRPYYENTSIKDDSIKIQNKFVKWLGNSTIKNFYREGMYVWVTKDNLINFLKTNGNDFNELYYNLGMDYEFEHNNVPFVAIGVPNPTTQFYCPTIFVKSNDYFRPKFRKDNWGETLNSKNLNPGFSEAIIKNLSFPKQDYQDLVAVGNVSVKPQPIEKRSKELLVKSVEDMFKWDI
jgi:hypothetical protein